MKKALCVVLVALVVGMAGMPVEAKPQPIFRDLAWGTSPEVLGDRREVTSAFTYNPYNLRFFLKINEDLQLGPIKAEGIVYGFWNDQLSDILVYTKSASDAYNLQSLYWIALEPYVAVSWRKTIVDDENMRVYYIPQTETYYTAFKQKGLLELQGVKMWDRIAKSTPPPF